MAIAQIGYTARVANDDSAPNRIREIRETMDISQAELARRAHAHPSTMNKIELGIRGLDQEWMRRIARALGVQPAELLPDDENPDRLSDEERQLIERLRSAGKRERETFTKVADAMLPFKHRTENDAA